MLFGGGDRIRTMGSPTKRRSLGLAFTVGATLGERLARPNAPRRATLPRAYFATVVSSKNSGIFYFQLNVFSYFSGFNFVIFHLFGNHEHARTPKELSCRMEFASKNP
jgi:hypothetical protein